MNIGRPKRRRRYEVLAAIRENPRASLDELAQACGMKAKSQVRGYLKDLESEGLIYRLKGARQIYLGKRPEHVKPVKVPRPRIVESAVGSVKKDPRLEARIETVVQKALVKEQSAPTVDVVRGRQWIIHLDGLKANRIG
jgi:DNA-binding IclR family transcriptional regulator